MTNSILIQNLTHEQLGNLIDEKLRDQFQELKKYLEKENLKDQLLTRKEASEFLKIDSSTLWAWTNSRRVKSYGIGNRRYYKLNELLESLVPLKK